MGGLKKYLENGKSEGVGGSYVKFPPWWGYGYFLEPHIHVLRTIPSVINAHVSQHGPTKSGFLGSLPPNEGYLCMVY